MKRNHHSEQRRGVTAGFPGLSYAYDFCCSNARPYTGFRGRLSKISPIRRKHVLQYSNVFPQKSLKTLKKQTPHCRRKNLFLPNLKLQRCHANDGA